MRLIDIAMKGMIALAIVAFLSGRTEAQEIGTRIVCDEQAQIERFVALTSSETSAEEAVKQVNAGTTACGILTVAFHPIGEVAKTKNATTTFSIVAIVVIGVWNGSGFVPIPPVKQFTLVKLEGKEV